MSVCSRWSMTMAALLSLDRDDDVRRAEGGVMRAELDRAGGSTASAPHRPNTASFAEREYCVTDQSCRAVEFQRHITFDIRSIRTVPVDCSELDPGGIRAADDECVVVGGHDQLVPGPVSAEVAGQDMFLVEDGFDAQIGSLGAGEVREKWRVSQVGEF